jgi:hypothetical protein
MRMPKTVDRRIASAIAYKRIFTGSLALAGGAGVVAAVASHGGGPVPLVALALLIFFGGGAWTLRDGLRLLRALRAEGAPTR